MDTNKQESQEPTHRMYCGKSGVRCLVNHMDGICDDVRDCEGCKAEESHEGVEETCKDAVCHHCPYFLPDCKHCHSKLTSLNTKKHE